MEKPEKIAIENSFIYANYNYRPLVWHFSKTLPENSL